MLIPKLETERLILREWRESDFEIYAGMMSDIDVVRYLSGVIMGRGEAWRQMASMAGHWMLRGYGYWAVEEKSSGAFVGRVGLWYPDSWPGLEIGWTIDKTHWGKGYAPEAGTVAMDYAFQTQNLTELLSVIHHENEKLDARRREARRKTAAADEHRQRAVCDLRDLARRLESPAARRLGAGGAALTLERRTLFRVAAPLRFGAAGECGLCLRIAWRRGPEAI